MDLDAKLSEKLTLRMPLSPEHVFHGIVVYTDTLPLDSPIWPSPPCVDAVLLGVSVCGGPPRLGCKDAWLYGLAELPYRRFASMLHASAIAIPSAVLVQ